MCLSRKYLAVLMVGLLWRPLAAAESPRAPSAHVHGHAALDVAIEGAYIDAELRTPAMNLLGFEHAPRNDGQRQALARAIAWLEDGAARLRPSANAGCRIEQAQVVTSAIASEDGKEHNQAQDHESGHEHDHAHDSGHEHESHDEASGPGHDDGHSEEAVHSELQARYRFHCDDPNAIEMIQVDLFDAYPGMQEIELQALAAGRQIGGSLTADNNVISLAR